MNIQEITEAYDELVKRAFLIVDGAPFWAFVYEEAHAKLRIDGDTATLSWPRAEGGWEGSCSTETEHCQFPTRLIAMNDDELATWKAEQKAEYERKQKEKKRQERLAEEAALRSQFEALKARFGYKL